MTAPGRGPCVFRFSGYQRGVALHIGFGYDAKAGPEDRATQACDPSAEAGGYTAGRVGPIPALPLSPLEA